MTARRILLGAPVADHWPTGNSGWPFPKMRAAPGVQPGAALHALHTDKTNALHDQHQAMEGARRAGYFTQILGRFAHE